MKCPFCGSDDTKVIDSRPADDNCSIRRRRSCDKCNKRFTTYEKVETIPLVVIKKDNNREPYDRSKIEAGVLRACHKRPVSINQINQLIDEVVVTGEGNGLAARIYPDQDLVAKKKYSDEKLEKELFFADVAWTLRR